MIYDYPNEITGQDFEAIIQAYNNRPKYQFEYYSSPAFEELIDEHLKELLKNRTMQEKEQAPEEVPFDLTVDKVEEGDDTHLPNFFDTLKFDRRQRRQLGLQKKWSANLYDKMRAANKNK